MIVKGIFLGLQSEDFTLGSGIKTNEENKRNESQIKVIFIHFVKSYRPFLDKFQDSLKTL